MINKADIRKECEKKSTFEKAEALHRSGAVRKLEYVRSEQDGFEVTTVTGVVEGSTGNLYDVGAVIDEDYREILEYSCDCPAYFSYYGPCKHCAALLLEYIHSRRGGVGTYRQNMNERMQKPQREPGASAYVTSKRLRPTTFGFDRLVEEYMARERSFLQSESHNGDVMLVPSFRLNQNSLTVEFRIGCRRLYILKNIGEFVLAMSEHKTEEYGRELTLTHRLEAFDPAFRPLVEFVQYSLSQGNKSLDSYLPSLYKKEWKLQDAQLDGFMECIRILSEQEIPVEGSVRSNETMRWKFEEGEQIQTLHIEGEDNGIRVMLEQVPMLWGVKYVYLFSEGKICRMERSRAEEIRSFGNYIEMLGQDGLYVSQRDLGTFTGELLPVLEKHYQIRRKNYDPRDYLPPEGQYEVYLDAPSPDLVTAAAYVLYGEEKYPLTPEGAQNGANRDLRTEYRMLSAIGSFFNAFDPDRGQYALTGEDEIYAFLQDGVNRLNEICTVFVSDALHDIRVLPAPRMNVGISVTGDLLELELVSDELPMDELIDILSRYDRKKKYHRLKNGSFVDLSDEGIAALADLREDWNYDGAAEEGRLKLPGYRAFYLDQTLQQSSAVDFSRDSGFRRLVRSMKTPGDGDFEIPESLRSTLREYQKTGYRFMRTLKANGFCGILADDMGLGKTLQVIALLLSDWEEHGGKPDKPYGIVCPASLVYNWKSELERFAPKLPVSIAVGSVGNRRFVTEELKYDGRGVLITSYDLLRRDLDLYEDLDFGIFVIDEAQFIKNYSTQAAKAVKQIKSDFRMALTGTPVENRLSELWSIFDFLMPGFLYSYNGFRETWEHPIAVLQDERAAEALKKLIRPFVLRRLKKDVLTDLPDKIEKNMYAAMEGEQWDLYTAHVQRLVMMLNGKTEEEFSGVRMQVLSELTRLRQLCCDPALVYEGYQGGSAKTELGLELIRDAVEGGHKILLFSQFTSMLERLKARLREENISFYSLDGSTPKERRLELVQAFNKDDTQVFCISLKAGGTGLNLTGADIVIHFDPWWNAAVQNQATDRAHRIGQENVVTVFRLIARDSVEEKIVALQELKKDLAEQILGEANMGPAAFTREELLEILE